MIALVPNAVAMVTSTVPALPAGALTTSWVALAEVMLAVGTVTAPNFTVLFAAVVLKPVPAMVTEFPPSVGPEVGLTDVTVGGGGVRPVRLMVIDLSVEPMAGAPL